METPATTRIERLSQVSARRVIEPDAEVTGEFTKPQIFADEFLSVVDLDLDLTPEQRAKLSREELAANLRFGIMLETVLISGFAFQAAMTRDVTDARVTYALHEIGEEARHSRLFARAIGQLRPTQWNPFDSALASRGRKYWMTPLIRRPALLDACVLLGEELQDRWQQPLVDHPDTDEYLRAMSRYHRYEEARHLTFARLTVGEHYRNGGVVDRWAVRWLVPAGAWIGDLMVHPFVYSTVGLPPIRTWRRVRSSPSRRALRHHALRGVLRPLLDSGAMRRVPWAWRKVAAVDRKGRPITP